MVCMNMLLINGKNDYVINEYAINKYAINEYAINVYVINECYEWMLWMNMIFIATLNLKWLKGVKVLKKIGLLYNFLGI